MPGQDELITRFARDLIYYCKAHPNVSLESIDHATPEMDFDLATARNDKQIHNRSGDGIFITALTGVAYIRTRPDGAKYKLKVGKISLPFKKLYLTNTAQAGKSVSIIIGYGAFVDFINPSSEEKQSSILTKIETTLAEVQKLSTPVSVHDTSTGAALTVSLEVGHRRFVEIWMKTSAAATFYVAGSKDNINWRDCDEIEFDGAGELKNGYFNSDRYVKVSTTDANNNEIEITAS